MKTLTNEKELFALFVDEESDRDFIQKPFYNPRYNEVWASDYYILLMIKDYENNPDLTKNLRCPEIGKAIHEVLLIDELKAKLQDIKLVDEFKEIKCEECGGSGSVKWEYYSDRQQRTFFLNEDCPECDGFGYSKKIKTGRKVIAEEEDILLNGVRFAAKYINILVQAMELLGLREVTWINCSPCSGNMFELNEDIRVIIMPKL